jgi:uncharacterized protein (DUF305 family)
VSRTCQQGAFGVHRHDLASHESYEPAVSLAEQIEVGQAAEIETMQGLLS